MDVQDDAFHVPILFLFLCCFAAAAFLLATYFCLWRASRVPADEDCPPLWSYIQSFQYLGFLSVAILSCILGLYDWVSIGRPLGLYAEGLVLIGAVVYAFSKGGAVACLKLIRCTIMFFVAACAFWALSAAMGWAIGVGLHMVYSSFAPIETFGMMAVLCVGVSWIAPIIVTFRRLNKERRRGMKFYNVLVPVLLAYFMLLVPLFVEQTANSEKWQKMMHYSKPVRKI